MNEHQELVELKKEIAELRRKVAAMWFENELNAKPATYDDI